MQTPRTKKPHSKAGKLALELGWNRQRVYRFVYVLGAPRESKEEFLKWYAQYENGKPERRRLAMQALRKPAEVKAARRQATLNRYKTDPAIKAWHAQRAKRYLPYRRAWQKNRMATDPEFKLRKYLGKRIRTVIKDAGSVKLECTLKLCGCSAEELRAHLESQFKRGMSWSNYGKVWHVDHIIPCAKFDLTKPEEQAKCFNYLNLQPLWRLDNILKHDKITAPSQIPLGFIYEKNTSTPLDIRAGSIGIRHQPTHFIQEP